MNTEAVILAGGIGSRLRSVVADRPKVLAAVNGRPFITYLLDQLADAGVASVVISTGYMADKVEAELGPAFRNVRLAYSRECDPLGTGGGLRLALDSTRAATLLVLNGDSYCAADIKALLEFHAAKRATATLTLARVADSSRFGRVETDVTDSVCSFVEKGGPQGPGWINAGIYCLNREVIEEIPTGRPVSLEREVFPKLIGNSLYGFQSDGRFLDIGTPESYAAAERFFA